MHTAVPVIFAVRHRQPDFVLGVLVRVKLVVLSREMFKSTTSFGTEMACELTQQESAASPVHPMAAPEREVRVGPVSSSPKAVASGPGARSRPVSPKTERRKMNGALQGA